MLAFRHAASLTLTLRLPCDTVEQIEQTAVPTACMWHPPQEHAREDLLVTASDEYKLKMWNATNKACRRTVVSGPLW